MGPADRTAWPGLQKRSRRVPAPVPAGAAMDGTGGGDGEARPSEAEPPGPRAGSPRRCRHRLHWVG